MTQGHIGTPNQKQEDVASALFNSLDTPYYAMKSWVEATVQFWFLRHSTRPPPLFFSQSLKAPFAHGGEAIFVSKETVSKWGQLVPFGDNLC